MNTVSTATRWWGPRALSAILVGGATAGTIDLILAYISFGVGMPRGIAAGLLGPSARQGGPGVYILGLFLHFFIAFSAATVYYFASRKLDFMIWHPFVSGIFFGIGLWLVMNLIVLPLCAFHFTGPYMLKGMIQGLLVHMFLIGLPIALIVRRYST